MDMTQRANEQIRVEDYLYLVATVISVYITPHTDITGMEYDDLYQTGCLALCKAASSYCAKKEASFATYAAVVIRNQLYDYCRRMNHIHSRLLYLDASLSEDGEDTFLQSQVLNQAGASSELFPLLLEIHEEYSGIAAKGVEALLLQADGYTGKEIAKMYHVEPNHIYAWISRACSRLRKDPRILAAAK